jgi:hypothetical protein
MLKDNIAEYSYRCFIFLHNFFFVKKTLFEIFNIFTNNLGFVVFHNTNDDQLTQGQNINI